MNQATTTAGTRTLDDEGVRVFLHAANEETHAAHQLREMYFARKRGDTPQAEALLTGWHCTRRAAEESVRELRKRGGLLHLGRAQVHYKLGEYTVIGGAA